MFYNGNKYLINFDYVSEDGHQSGLNYVNDPNIKFELHNSGNTSDGRPYRYKFNWKGTQTSYFSENGFLLMVESPHRNTVSYFYTNMFNIQESRL